MKMRSIGLFLVSTTAAASIASAQNKPAQPVRSSAQLQRALGAVAASVQSTMPPAKTVDNDQGDDHASPTAILKVCSKDTPAARRSAICPVGLSPD
jgi:hypothetical protein